jgi:erythromycin esterase-like protein
VIAGSEWGAPMQEMEVPPAREGSIEHHWHQQETGDRYFLFNSGDTEKLYATAINHRAIGVVYNPERERLGNYVPSVMSRRYDAFVFIDRTSAVHALGIHPHHEKTQETYPYGY